MGRDQERCDKKGLSCVVLEHAGHCSCPSLGLLAGRIMSPGIYFSKQQIEVYPLRWGSGVLTIIVLSKCFGERVAGRREIASSGC